MLIIHQAILIPGMKTNLLSPMQLRDNDLRVNDEPKFMVPKPTEDHHAIYIPEVKGESPALRIPLSLHGVTSYFPTRKPTQDEYEKSELDYHLELTSESPEWELTKYDKIPGAGGRNVGSKWQLTRQTCDKLESEENNGGIEHDVPG